MILIAMDKASVRRLDKDGRLHVEVSNIAKACVSPYYGHEIPGWDELGLDPDRVYNMLRDPEELEKAVPTFNNIPLLIKHKPTSADDHPKEITVGTVGSNAKWSAPYITNSLAAWDGAAIDLIDSKEQHELSPGYHYTPDMTSGEFDGVDYDGVMRDIVANHVALVTEGRQGPDVVVGDESMLKSRKALMLSGAVAALVRPKLAQDAKVDLAGLFGSVTAKNLKAQRTKLAGSIVTAVQPHLAADEGIDVDDVCKVIDAVQGTPMGEDEDDAIPDVTLENEEMGEDEGGEGEKVAALLNYLKGKLSDEDYAEAARLVQTEEASDENPDGPELEDHNDNKGPAMDMATVKRMIADAEKRGAEKGAKIALDSASALRIAEADVAPLVGRLANPPATAEEVYRLALDSVGVPKAAYEGVGLASLKAQVESQISRAKPRPPIALDAKSDGQAATLFPNAGKLVRI